MTQINFLDKKFIILLECFICLLLGSVYYKILSESLITSLPLICSGLKLNHEPQSIPFCV